MLVCVFRRLIQSLKGDADKCPSGRVQHQACSSLVKRLCNMQSRQCKYQAGY